MGGNSLVMGGTLGGMIKTDTVGFCGGIGGIFAICLYPASVLVLKPLRGIFGGLISFYSLEVYRKKRRTRARKRCARSDILRLERSHNATEIRLYYGRFLL